ncbi:hypothetical protein JY651_40710 [Pyxidicoccus parkwayensis]|uniref:Uncharacterized protein n=1 Tax=Pyxidicoccus parkwayensis TaxID=2813578 RepID=A0ABX7NRD9_9BACT|nr:hypothetical protein [Pyxidicoccus parkwaysis]QSQ21446.1 hypothetical protein JY651_40710 [Pyxidicoccus parkwaysis]
MTTKSLQGFNFRGLTTAFKHTETAKPQKNQVATQPDKKNSHIDEKGRYKNSFETGSQINKNYSKSYSHGDTSDLFTPNANQSKAGKLASKLPGMTLAEGSFEKSVVGYGKSGSFGSPGGIAQGQGSFTVGELSASGSGKVSFEGGALKAVGDLKATATLLHAQGSARIGKGDYNLEASGEAYVGAQAKAHGELTIDPAKGIYAAKVGGEAFAGARAGVEAQANLGKFGSVGGRAEAWAGVGASFNAELGFKNGRLKARFDIGAALGVGFKLGFNVDIDLKGIKDTVKKVIEKPVEVIKDIGKSVGNALKKLKFW